MNGNYLTLGVGDLFAAADGFMREYGANSPVLNAWFQVILDCCDIIDQVAQQIAYHVILADSPLYRTIPFQALQLQQSLYSDAAMAAAHAGWESMATSDKIAILDAAGLYESLDVRRPMDSEADNGKHRLITAVLDRLVGASNPYIPSVDYAFANNRLYVFGALAAPAPNAQAKTVYLKNIQLDLNDLEEVWGNLLGYQQPAEFTPIVYRGALIWLLQIYFNGPTVAALQKLSEEMGPAWQSFTVMDQINAPASMQWLWTGGTLTPFQFVLLAPAEQSAVVLGSNFDVLMQRIKPQATGFELMWTTQPIVESVPLQDSVQLTYVDDPEIPRQFALSDGPLTDEGIFADTDIVADKLTAALGWRANQDTTTEFELWRGENGASPSLLATLPNTGSYIGYQDLITSFPGGTTLAYSVRAIGSSQDSQFSPTLTLTI